MTTTVSRSTFTQLLQGKALAVREAQQDARLQGVNVARADLNRDGNIGGDTEAAALFKELDRFDRDGSAATMRVLGTDGHKTPVAPKLEAIGDLAGVPVLRGLANAGPAPAFRRSNNDVLMVGMNTATANHEVAHLRGRGLDVTQLRDTAVDDTIKVGGTTYDLTQDHGIQGFVSTLGLPRAQGDKIADVIRGGGSDARDELAQIAQVFAKGEKGGTIPSRLMISSHSTGGVYWGDGNGTIQRSSIMQLAEAMPQAARQVQDIHLSACYSGGQDAMNAYRAAFPNAKTIWAYAGTAPGAHSGATAHMSRWDVATRGDKNALTLALAAGTRKGENVAVWSEAHGYLDGRPPEAIATVRARVAAGEPTFIGHFSGDQAVTDTQSGPLRSHYNDVQAALQHTDLPPSERPALELRMEQAIRLLYFTKTVAPNFQRHHAASIAAGYSALGLTPPDFSRLSRKDALGAAAAFERKVNELGAGAPAAARSLLGALTSGLRDLHPAAIPPTWI